MSTVVETFLICDGNCGNTFGVDQRGSTGKKQRESAKANGWIYKNGKDYCPDCKNHYLLYKQQTNKIETSMKKKIVYVTQWVAKDNQKEYPHGWGFEPPIVEFSQDTDPVKASEFCRELSNDEFECIGATARDLIDGDFEILGIIPGPEKDSEEWLARDIDLVLDNADFGNDWKIKEISRNVKKFLGNNW